MFTFSVDYSVRLSDLHFDLFISLFDPLLTVVFSGFLLTFVFSLNDIFFWVFPSIFPVYEMDDVSLCCLMD